MKKVFNTPEIDVLKFAISENITGDATTDLNDVLSQPDFEVGDGDDFDWE